MTSRRHPNWRFARLWPQRHPRAGENEAALGGSTLGVEVTEPALAARCGLGNIDPQHGGGNPAQAAIEAALDWPVPPDGTTIVTFRQDADALGAMAVLLMRARGLAIAGIAAGRVAQIAHWDKLALGRWTDWRLAHPPLFRPARSVDLGGRPLALQAINAVVRNQAIRFDARVEAVADWLAGAPPPRHGVAAALAHEARLLADWNAGRIALEPGGNGRMALLRADAGTVSALDLAYRLAPVVVAEAQMPEGRKFTIAQFEPGWLDMTGLLADMRAREAGWGGSTTIIGSPQGAASRLSFDVVAALAGARLTPG